MIYNSKEIGRVWIVDGSTNSEVLPECTKDELKTLSQVKQIEPEQFTKIITDINTLKLGLKATIKGFYRCEPNQELNQGPKKSEQQKKDLDTASFWTANQTDYSNKLKKLSALTGRKLSSTQLRRLNFN